MGTDYRWYLDIDDDKIADFELKYFCKPLLQDQKTCPTPESFIKESKYSWNLNNNHSLIFTLSDCGGYIVDTTVRYGSVVMDKYITGVLNTLLRYGDVYVGDDCSLFCDEICYILEAKAKGSRWITKDLGLLSISDYIIGKENPSLILEG